jgi:hypothetical protein
MRLAVVALSTSTIREENVLFSEDLIIQFMQTIFIVACKYAFCFSSFLAGLSPASRPRNVIGTLWTRTAYTLWRTLAKDAILFVQLRSRSKAALSDSLAVCRIMSPLTSLFTAWTLHSAGETSSLYKILARRLLLMCFLMLSASFDYSIFIRICLLMRADSLERS